MKKKTTQLALFLLLTILFISFRFLFFISYVQLQKSSFREQVVNTQLKEVVHLKFSEKDLYQDKNGYEWNNDNKELVIEGRYYEVLSIQEKGDHYQVDLTEDVWENDLFRMFFDAEEANEELPEDILSDLEMDFLIPTIQPNHFQNGKSVEHRTGYTSDSGTDVYSRTEKPPRA